ncbi:MAG: MATE family efflux transporter [Pseudomonadota bacterium]
MTDRPDRYTHRRILAIAGPMIASNITVPLLGIVDTAVVGHLDSPHYLAAVAVGATLFSFVFYSFNFLRMGTTGVAAQAAGHSDTDGVRGVLLQSAVIALCIAALMLALQAWILDLGLALIKPDAAVAASTAAYFSIRIWAAPAALLNFALMGWFIGLQKARAPLAVMLVVNVTNIGLDLLFVLGFEMDVRGVALASLCAEYSGLVFALWLAHRSLAAWPSTASWRDLLQADRLRRLVSVNQHLLVRSLSLMFSFALFTALGARQGSLILAANAVLLTFQNLTSYALDGFANAAEALIGHAVGAKDKRGLDRAWRRTLAWSAGIGVVIALIYAVGGVWLIERMTDLPEVRRTAVVYLPWLVLLPLTSTWCFFYDGVFVGATMARQMRNTMLIATFLCFVPLAFGLLSPLQNHGLWLALNIFMLARATGQHVLWRRTRTL